MTYSPILIVHICGGIVGVLSGSTALLVRKGSRLHRKAGVAFVISMMTMAAAGAYVALTKSQPPNVIAGAFTFYLVATAWLTVTRKEKETGQLEFGLLLVGLAAGIGSLILGWRATHNTEGTQANGFRRTLFCLWDSGCTCCRRRHSHAHSRRCCGRTTTRAPSVANGHCVVHCGRFVLSGNVQRSSAAANWITRQVVHGRSSQNTSPGSAGTDHRHPDDLLGVSGDVHKCL